MTSTQRILVQPNVFELGGYNTQISYSTTSFTGVPQLTYTNRGQTLSFSGAEIQTEQTQLGQIMTVSLSSNLAIGNFESLSLLIPTISLPLDSKQGSIQTIAVFNLRSPLVKHSGQSHYMTCLCGTAQQVEF